MPWRECRSSRKKALSRSRSGIEVQPAGKITKGTKAMLVTQQTKDFEGMQISRRRFFAVSGVGALLFARRPLLAAEDGIVPTMVNAAANAKIVTYTLRRNIS